jgi:hypothetical protein
LANLIDGNSSNASHFVVSGLIARLPPLLTLQPSDYLMLVDGKADALSAACSLICTLVPPDSPATPEVQSSLLVLLPQLCALALTRVPHHRVRASALRALSATLRGCQTMCVAFSEAHVCVEGVAGVQVGVIDRAVVIALAESAHESESLGKCVKRVLQSPMFSILSSSSSLDKQEPHDCFKAGSITTHMHN